MTESKRLAAHQATAASADDIDPPIPGTPDDEDECAGKKKDKKQMSDNTDTEAAVAAARTEATKAANARFTTVLASEHYAGREQLAQTLLANDKLIAEEIISALTVAPKASAEPVGQQANTLTAEQQSENAEAAARAEMQAAIADNRNSNVDANGGGSPGGDKKADASAVWARARANVYPNQTK